MARECSFSNKMASLTIEKESGFIRVTKYAGKRAWVFMRLIIPLKELKNEK